MRVRVHASCTEVGVVQWQVEQHLVLDNTKSAYCQYSEGRGGRQEIVSRLAKLTNGSVKCAGSSRGWPRAESSRHLAASLPASPRSASAAADTAAGFGCRSPLLAMIGASLNIQALVGQGRDCPKGAQQTRQWGDKDRRQRFLVPVAHTAARVEGTAAVSGRRRLGCHPS